MIEYVGIYKSFDHPVLAGLDMTVRDGEILGIVGPSGTGKSVLLKVTCGLLLPERGDVQIDGVSLLWGPRSSLDAIRQTIGYVFQNAALFDSLNVFENVALGVREDEAHAIGFVEVAHRICSALEQVRLKPAEVLPKMPAELSGGMRKRVGLARAIVGRPRVLLYDEPVTGLDPITGAAVSRLIVEIVRDLGTTSIMTTHDVEGALDICHRVALLDAGRIRFMGTPDEFRSTSDPLAHAFVDRRAATAFAARSEVHP